MMTRYVELRAHSAFSFGDGAVTPEALVERASALGYAALGLTDGADLGGVIRFALEAERRGVKPVVGAELVVDGHPAAFLARDGRGFRNLAALVTRARVGSLRGWGSGERPEDAGGEPGRGRPGVDFEAVAKRSEGLIALTGPATGEAASLIRTGRPEEAMLTLERWRSVFGADRLAVEVQRHNVSGEESALAGALIELAERGGVPWVVTNAPRYLDGGGRLVHDLLTALRAGVDVDTAARRGVLHPNGEWRLKSPRAMARLWRGGERGLEESVRIAEECDFDLGWLRAPLPKFRVPEGYDDDDDSFLEELVLDGARERWTDVGKRQHKQIEHELNVIRRLGFAGFFLVMRDVVRFAKQRGILCQGRGSAANSVVAYCLGITAVDPVEQGLLFERFLSEPRTGRGAEAPDIDIDFEMHRREEVLDYVYERYRRPYAAITCTTLTYHAPSALQDVMRALGYPAELARTLSTRLRRFQPAEGAEALREGLAARHGLDVERDARGRAILAALRAMDGLPRLRATHPGGFVLSSEPLGKHLPIERTTMGRTILQFDKDDLDAVGVPKFDFLGIGGLSAIHRTFDAIEVRTGERPELYRLPTDDRKTFEMIADGDAVGLFQIESRAQIQSILHTRPERLYDLVVQVALIRPGPIQADFVRPYTRRRRGLEPVRYRHPDLEPILKRTYGIPIFQEQAMTISMELGGFTAAEADELRRAMGHRRKLPELHAALQRLKTRIASRGVDEATAEVVVNDLYSFANYGFPESHAWSFALIAYAHAYLKAHWPTEFYLGLLNSWPMGFYSPATLVHDARRHGVTVRPPCLKHGEWDCTLESVPVPGGVAAAPAPGPDSDDAVATYGSASEKRPGTGHPPALRLGLRFIEGLGDHTRDALRAAREDRPFASVDDVVRRARLTRAEALHLARAGAFEAFEPGRRRAAWEALRAAGDLLPLAPAHRPEREAAGRKARAADRGERAAGRGPVAAGRSKGSARARSRAVALGRTFAFDPHEPDEAERIFLDYLATGICTHGHPMEVLRPRLEAAGVTDSGSLDGVDDGAPIVVAGLVVARQHPATAKGTVFVLLEDEHGFTNVIVPARLYRANRETVRFSPFLLVEGRFERNGRVLNVVGRRFHRLETRAIAYRSHDFH